MKHKSKVFFVAAEVAPFVGSGPLADATGALPKALKELGHDIRMMMPNYRGVNERKYVLRDVIRLKDMAINFGQKTLQADGKSAFLPDSKVQIYFLDYKPLFDRQGLYADPKTKKPYADNAERFAFFALGCLETLKLLHWQPDVIHCNDWQTALIPYLLKTLYRDDSFFKNTKVLLTIHRLADQGEFPQNQLQALGLLPSPTYPGSQIKIESKFNFLRAGVLSADLISLVGEAQAKLIQQKPGLGFGLEDALQKRRRFVTGVTNGIDTAVWNPQSDACLEHHYSESNLSGKLENKKTFTGALGFDFEESTPLIAFLSGSESANQTGKLEKALQELLTRDVQVLVLGKFGSKFQKTLARLAKKHGARLFHKSNPEEKFLHRAMAAADLLFLHGFSAPESAVHLHAIRYGTLPIAIAGSGYAEATKAFGGKTNSTAGLLFTRCETDEVVTIVDKAGKLFKDKKRWVKIVKHAMKMNYSWNSVAQKYTKLYSQLAARAKK